MDEHHFNAGHTNSPNPVMFASMLAERTSRIRLGPAVGVTGWHPLRLAEDIALLDHFSKGRVELAIGRSGEDPELTERDMTYASVFSPQPQRVMPDSEPGARERQSSSRETAAREHFAEFLDLLKKGWTEPFFSHQGDYYAFPPPRPTGESSVSDAESTEEPSRGEGRRGGEDTPGAQAVPTTASSAVDVSWLRRHLLRKRLDWV